MAANVEPNAEPPVIIVGGSITIDLNPNDFPNGPKRVTSNLRIAGIVIEEENGNKQTVSFPTGRLKITLIRG